MIGNLIAVPFHIPGTLAANISLKFSLPYDATLYSIMTVNTAASDAVFEVGTSADANGFLTSSNVGDSSVPAIYDLDDFDGALVTNAGADYPYLSNGTVFTCDIDFDGSAGTAAANLTIIFTFQAA